MTGETDFSDELPPDDTPPESFETAKPVALAVAKRETPARIADRAAEPRRETRIEPRTSGAIGRSLPHSLEAEEQLLSCCLLDGSDTIARCQEAHLSAAAFFNPQNRLLYEQILSVHKRSMPVDLAVVAEELKSAGQLEAVGGINHLVKVSSLIGTTAQASYFIEKIRSQHVLRDLIRISAATVEQAYGVNGNLQEFIEQTRTRITAVLDNEPQADVLSKRAFDVKKTIEKPAPIFSLAGTCISTAGNLTTITSQAKTGKSALIGAMMAAAMTTPTSGVDTLGIEGPNYAKGAFIHLDTEQSPYDHYQLVRTAMRRAKTTDLPPWIMSYCMTGVPAADCRTMLEQIIRLAKRLFGSVFAIVIDGVADLVIDPNDPEECFPLVTKLHALAIEHSTTVINVLHLNPGSEAKSRGHLGSQLERKSESNIMLEKDSDDVTLIWGAKQRGKAITKANAVAFRWSDDSMMHTSCGNPKKEGHEPSGRKKKYEFTQFSTIFPRDPAKAIARQILLRMAKEVSPGISDSSFYRVIDEAIDLGLLTRTQAGVGFKYHMTPV
jgi:hypothetical protein